MSAECVHAFGVERRKVQEVFGQSTNQLSSSFRSMVVQAWTLPLMMNYPRSFVHLGLSAFEKKDSGIRNQLPERFDYGCVLLTNVIMIHRSKL